MGVVILSSSGPGGDSRQVIGVGDDTAASGEAVGWECCGVEDLRHAGWC